jgi:hypothetical protein
MTGRFRRKVLRPTEKLVRVLAATPMETEDDAGALFNCGGLERELDVARHLRKERIDGLAKEFPRGIGGLDVAPPRSSGARVELVDVETQHGLLHVVRDHLGIDVGHRGDSELFRFRDASWVALEERAKHASAFIGREPGQHLARAEPRLVDVRPPWIAFSSSSGVLASAMAVRLYHDPMTFGTGRRRSGAWSSLG